MFNINKNDKMINLLIGIFSSILLMVAGMAFLLGSQNLTFISLIAIGIAFLFGGIMLVVITITRRTNS